MGTFDVDAGAVVLDCGSVVLSAADRGETKRLAEEGVARLKCDQELARAVRVRGADGQSYVLAANFGDEAKVSVTLDVEADRAVNVATDDTLAVSDGCIAVELGAGEAGLLRAS